MLFKTIHLKKKFFSCLLTVRSGAAALLCASALLCVILTSCEKSSEAEILYSFNDSLGRTVDITSFEKTAVLSGSLAEIWQLAGGELYGITNDAYDGHSLDIPDDVKNYGDVKNPSVENMIADGVDLVILSGGIANHLKLEELISAAGITAAYFDVEDFDDYLSTLKIFTDITEHNELYSEHGTKLEEKIEAILSRAEQRSKQPSVLLLRAYSTGIKIKSSDNMTGKMLSQLGCINIADSDDSLLEELSLEVIIRAEPDFIFITTMGDAEAAAAQYEVGLASNPAWQGLAAVKAGKVFILPKELFHYKPNERWDEAYEYLEEILYGEKLPEA